MIVNTPRVVHFKKEGGNIVKTPKTQYMKTKTYFQRAIAAIGFMNIAMAMAATILKVAVTILPAILEWSKVYHPTAHQSGTSSIEVFANWYFGLWPIGIIPLGLASIYALIWLGVNRAKIY